MSKNFECVNCQKSFSRKWNMQRHYEKCKKKVSTSVQCEIITPKTPKTKKSYFCCGRDHKNNSNYSKHLKTTKHLNAIRGYDVTTIHKCPLCDYSTRYTTALRKHKKTHLKKPKAKPKTIVKKPNQKKIEELQKQLNEIYQKISALKSQLTSLKRKFQVERTDEVKAKLKQDITIRVDEIKKLRVEFKSIDNLKTFFTQ